MELVNSAEGINYFAVQWSGQYKRIMEQVDLTVPVNMLCVRFRECLCLIPPRSISSA